MTTAAEANKYAGPTSQFVPVDWEPIVPDTEDLARGYRAIRASAECTIEVRMPGYDGVRTLKFLAGETRYGMFTRVEAISAGDAEGAI